MHSVLASLDVVENGLWAVNHDLVRIDDLAAHHLQIVGLFFVWLQEIVEALLVDLKIVHHELEGSALFLDGVIHKFKDVANGTRNDTVLALDLLRDLTTLLDHFDDGLRSKHGVGFACSTHTISEDSSIESGCEELDRFLTSVIVHFLLGGFDKDIIEGVL